MFISRRSNGIYYLWYEDETGKKSKVSTGCNRKTDAITFLKSFIVPASKTSRMISSCTLTEFCGEFLDYAKTRYRPSTCRGTFKMAFNAIIRILGDVQLKAIDERTAERFLTIKLKESSGYTARICYGGLASAFQTAYKWKLIPRNPWRGIKKPAAPPIHPLYLSRSDVEKLLKEITDPTFQRLCIFGIATGMRAGEIINLKWDAVDLQNKVIHVQNTPTFTTKSRQNRVLPMSDTIYKMLVSLPQVHSAVFINGAGSPWSRDRITRIFKHYVLAAGLNPRFHFHSLRHTFASWLVQDGVSLFEVQKLLGHSNIAVTQVYSHLQPETLHATVNRITIPMN